jgi:type IV pilus assembly protein PilO
MILGMIDDFLEQPARTKYGVLGIAIFLLTALDWQFFYGPRMDKLSDLQTAVLERKTELETKRTKANNRATVEREVRELSADLKRAEAQLPDQREIADLLSAIAASGRSAGLDITLFRQKPEVYHDFYAEVPVQMEMRGTYHDVAAFLDRVKRLDRIVNIGDIQLRKPRVESDRVMLDASGTAVTFRFLDEEERAKLAEQKKKQQQQPGAKKGSGA